MNIDERYNISFATKTSSRSKNKLNTKFENIEGEIWEFYNEHYKVSNKGRILSLNYNKPILLNPYKKANGYYEIKLSFNNKKVHEYIHRLVAKVFIENPNNFDTVNHINNDKSDNTVENLEWMNGKENTHISFNNKVCQLDLNGNLINTYDNARTAAISINRLNCYSSIVSCLNKVPYYKTACGYKWIYKSEYDEHR